MSGPVNSGQPAIIAATSYTSANDQTNDQISSKVQEMLKDHLNESTTSDGKLINYSIGSPSLDTSDSSSKVITTFKTRVNEGGVTKEYTATVTKDKEKYRISIEEPKPLISASIESITESVVGHCFGGDTVIPPANRKTHAFRQFLFEKMREEYSIPIIYNSVFKEIKSLAEEHKITVSPRQIHLLIEKKTQEHVKNNQARLKEVQKLSQDPLKKMLVGLEEPQKDLFLDLAIKMPTPSPQNFTPVCNSLVELLDFIDPENESAVNFGHSLLAGSPRNLKAFLNLSKTGRTSLLDSWTKESNDESHQLIFNAILSPDDWEASEKKLKQLSSLSEEVSTSDYTALTTALNDAFIPKETDDEIKELLTLVSASNDIIYSFSSLTQEEQKKLLEGLKRIENPSLRQETLEAILLPQKTEKDATRTHCSPKLNTLLTLLNNGSFTELNLKELNTSLIMQLVTSCNTGDNQYNINSLTQNILDLPDDVFESFLSTPSDQSAKIDAIDRLHKSDAKDLILSSSQNLESYLTLTTEDQKSLLESLLKLPSQNLKIQFAYYILTNTATTLDAANKTAVLAQIILKNPSEKKLDKCFLDNPEKNLIKLLISPLVAERSRGTKKFIKKAILENSTENLQTFLHSDQKEQQEIIATLRKIRKASEVNHQALAQVALKQESRPAIISLLDNNKIADETRSFLLRVISQANFSQEQNMTAQLLISAIAQEAHNPKSPTAQALWGSIFKVGGESDLSELTEENFLSMAIGELEDDTNTLFQAVPFIQEDLYLKSAIALSTKEKNDLTLNDFSTPPQVKTTRPLKEIEKHIMQHSPENITLNNTQPASLTDSLKSLPDEQKRILFFILAQEAGTVPGFHLFAPGVKLNYNVDTSKQPIEVAIDSKEDSVVSVHLKIKIHESGSQEYTELEYTRPEKENPVEQ
jgi:hypothetical protein